MREDYQPATSSPPDFILPSMLVGGAVAGPAGTDWSGDGHGSDPGGFGDFGGGGDFGAG